MNNTKPKNQTIDSNKNSSDTYLLQQKLLAQWTTSQKAFKRYLRTIK